MFFSATPVILASTLSGYVTQGGGDALYKHYISNASSILLFNILHVFDFIKIMYFEC